MNLNESQEIAKNTIDWPLLIIAWAWSWKTATLTSRVDFMIREKWISPLSILCVTFTNKAAKEMRERIGRKLWVEITNNMYTQRNLPLIWTFHAIWMFFLKEVLKKYSPEVLWLWIKWDFLIYGEDDKMKLMKDILVNDLNLDEKQFPSRQIAYYISEAKNSFMKAKDYEKLVDSFIKEKVLAAYKIYEKKMQENNALDFDDILFKTLELFKNNSEVLEYYQEKYRYIMVDEYQDTNLVQYELVKLLASKYRNLAVVGDDWQSIYSWRGADMRNIINFKKDYSEAVVVKLEQNYRSTKNIIEAANILIKNNKTALDKTLYTDNEEWEKITLIEAIDDRNESNTIAKIIKEKYEFNLLNGKETVIASDSEAIQKSWNNIVNGLLHSSQWQISKYSDNLILYRTNGQSRQIEEALLSHGIPYKVVWGLKFYDRKEIKDIIGYLRVIFNSNDVISFKRIINTPSRKIWARSIEVLDLYKDNFSLPYFQILENVEEIDDLNSGAKRSVKEFFNLILNFKEVANRLEVSKLIEYIIDKLDYKVYLISEYWTEEADEKWSNLTELINLASNYNWLESHESLSQFLEEIALISDLDTKDTESDFVTLMTIHTSKWLEEKRVFITWMEDWIFPHSRSTQDLKELEEERRLLYVALTRAKKELYISRSIERFYFWSYVRNPPSRFLKEIPIDTIKKYEAPKSNFFTSSTTPDFDTKLDYTPTYIKKEARELNDASQFAMWDRVNHHKFWNWIIVSLTWELAEIAFSWVWIRKMNIAIAPVKKI